MCDNSPPLTEMCVLKFMKIIRQLVTIANIKGDGMSPSDSELQRPIIGSNTGQGTHKHVYELPRAPVLIYLVGNNRATLKSVVTES